MAIDYIVRALGLAGALLCVAIFARQPSFPTPDKLLAFLTCIFLMIGQAKEMLKRFVPFVALLLVYESFRGVVPSLNERVNFMFMPAFDESMFGSLPTVTLQTWLWNGSIRWYDMLLYFVYMLHFVLPLGLAILVWKYRGSEYWRYMSTFLLVSFVSFVVFLLFPAAPPWMASDLGYIQPVERIASHVWAAFGIQDFPSLYNRISPNPVAAVPSLHTTYAVLLAMFVYRYFGKKWGRFSILYPALIMFGTVYQGEHYVIDILIGILFAIGGYYAAGKLYHIGRHELSRRKAALAEEPA